jgi:AraC-like DNA-binding protein
MTQTFEHSAATPGWRAVHRERGSALAAGAVMVRPRSCGRQPKLRVQEQRLDEAVSACGYDAQRISQYFGITVRHLQRWFRAHMGFTPGVWLCEMRLQEARRRLHGSPSVKEVAYSLGFKSAAQFSRDFKRRFGNQPSTELAHPRPQPPACPAPAFLQPSSSSNACAALKSAASSPSLNQL